MDNVFRTKQVENEAPAKEQNLTKKDEVVSSSVEVPFSLYENTNKHPYTADYFQLGALWNDSTGGFETEVKTIENYFKKRVTEGELQDNIKAVNEHIKKLYKLCNIDKTERVTMQIEKLSAYCEYLNKIDGIKINYKKYGYR